MSVQLTTNLGVRNVLAREDFASTCFVCNAGGLLETTVFKGTSMTGNGSAANPLAVKLSTDAGNSAVFGGDGGVFVPASVPFAFDITDGATTQGIATGNTITFVGTGAATATVSATDTVTIDVPLPIVGAECPAGFFVGAPV